MFDSRFRTIYASFASLACFACAVFGQLVYAELTENVDAHRLIYETQHFESVVRGQVIKYEASHLADTASGTESANFEEMAALVVSSVDTDYRANVILNYPMFGQTIEFPELSGVIANPVITAFLEFDIREMSRRTG